MSRRRQTDALRRLRCRAAVVLAVGLAGLLPTPGLTAEVDRPTAAGVPLPVRNLAPVTQLFGLPRPLGGLAPSGGVETSLTIEHSNNFAAAVDGDSAVLFDGSTTVSTLGLRGARGTRWEWGLELPWVYHDGGFTDGFIENFHDLFGFPDGDRGEAPRERIDYRVVDGGREYVAVTDSQGGVGDVRVQLGFALQQVPGRQVVLRGMLELPTGKEHDLSGSGSTDASLWFELADARWLEALGTTVTLAGGVNFPGESGLVPGQRDAIATGHLGLHYPLTRRVTLRAQLDAHGSTVRSSLEPLGDGALLGTLGGSVRLSRSLRLDLGLVEDLTPDHAPDVVFVTALRARF